MFADVGGTPAVYAGNGGDSGFGGGGAWLIAILFLAFAGRGFGGGCGGEGVRNEVDFAEINNRIDNVNALAEQRATYKEACDTHLSVAQLGREGVENKYDLAIQLKDMQAANAECCCATQRAIDQSSFENQKGQWEISRQISDCCCATQLNGERNTNAIIASQNAGTQRIVDMMTADKIESYRDKIQERDLRISQYEQNQYLTKVLGPQQPVPAYVTYPNCTPVFPPQIAASSNAVYGAFGLNGGNGCGCACGF